LLLGGLHYSYGVSDLYYHNSTFAGPQMRQNRVFLMRSDRTSPLTWLGVAKPSASCTLRSGSAAP
jgi:hypothetical protein